MVPACSGLPAERPGSPWTLHQTRSYFAVELPEQWWVWGLDVGLDDKVDYHQLDYFRREDKCAWWEFFRLHDLEHEDLLEERKAVSGLQFEGEVEGGTLEASVGNRMPTLEHRNCFRDDA